MDDVTDSITRLRTADFLPWAKRDMAKAFGIDESRITMYDKPDYKLGTTGRRINTMQTLADNPGLDRKKVKDWIKNYGNSVWGANSGAGYTPAAESHYDVLDTWKGASAEIERGTKQCLFNPYI